MTLAANLAALARRLVGTSANNLVALDGAAKLPAVDGSQLVNATGVKKRVSSGLLTPSAGGLLTWGHGLGSMPSRYWATLVCQTPELGYAVGEEIEAYGVSSTGTAYGSGVAVRSDATNVTARMGSNFPGVVINGSNGVGGQTLNMANWKVRLWAEL